MLPRLPNWMEHALQGLAFWIGHRHSYFYAYPLTEGALIAETCNLIQANLPSDLRLLPERMYRDLVGPGVTIPDVSGQSRADLVICDKKAMSADQNNIPPYVDFVIEVKRGSSTRTEIDDDLRRLANYLKASKAAARGLLFVISESRAHSRFVRGGTSIPGAHPISDTNALYRVRRTVKAATSFSGHETAHYVNLIEVFV